MKTPIRYLPLIVIRVIGAYPTYWTGCQYVTELAQRDRQPFTPIGNSELPNNLNCHNAAIVTRKQLLYPKQDVVPL